MHWHTVVLMAVIFFLGSVFDRISGRHVLSWFVLPLLFFYPLCFLKLLTRELSDHSPLVVDFGLSTVKLDKPFKLELCWFLRVDLVELVTIVWHGYYTGRDNIILLCGKIEAGNLGKLLKGGI